MTSIQSTMDQLKQMKLYGFYDELDRQLNNADYQQMSFMERVCLLVQQEYLAKKNKKLANRLKQADFRINACIGDISYRAGRNLDRSQIQNLGECGFINQHQNVLITGPAGAGKTHIACALGHRACLKGFKVKYIRFAKLFSQLSLAKEKNRVLNYFASLAKQDLIILDDWAVVNIDQKMALDLLEIFEDRYLIRSTIVTAQFPVETWHEKIEDPTLADAILDRFIHNSHRIEVKGKSVRKEPVKSKATSNTGNLERKHL